MSLAELSATFAVNSTRAITQDTKVTVETDAALVEEYNATHGTAYVAMPAGACILSATTVTIPKGQYSATDSVKISLNESSLASLTEKTYCYLSASPQWPDLVKPARSVA